MKDGWRRAGLWLLMAAFVWMGLRFIPRFGIEVDEALIANGIYAHGAPWYSWRFGEWEVPVMLISYFGALKTWAYSILFWWVVPGRIALRLPTLLLAASTLWMFFVFVDRAVGRRAAWIGTLLLATDVSYVLLNAIDHGPVTVQFACKLGALAFLLRFHQTGARAALGWAFFLFGLAMWDKAIFAWVLFGLAAGAVVTVPKQVWERCTWRNLAVAATAMVAGALPLIIYNVARPLETLRGNAQPEPLAVWGKATVLAGTMTGEVVWGFFTMVGTTSGSHQSLMLWASVAAVFGLALVRKRRALLFGIVTCVATWLPMVFTAGAGAAAHHVILLWPFHIFAIATALAQVPRRAAVILTTVLCASNLMVLRQHYVDVVRDGPSLRWTDAMEPLQEYLQTTRPQRIYVADWGIMETMNLLSEGRLPMYWADTSSDAGVVAMLGDERNLFVAHPREIAIRPGDRAALDAVARREQFQEEWVATIRDSHGRPTFDVFRFRKLHL